MKLILIILFFPITLWAQGGPPMVTDDPGTPGNGHWEINISSLVASTKAEDVYRFPYFDINYGWGEHIQLKLETGWLTETDHATNRSGGGTSLIGVKYRFLDEDKNGISISTYPQIQFRHFFSSHDPELAPSGREYVLPFEFSKTFGAWQVNPEIGYIYNTEVFGGILYGIVVAYENLKPWEPLAEVHVNSRFDGSGSTTLLNLGARYTVNPHLNLIGSAGHTVSEMKDEKPEFDAYLGVQIEI